MRRRDFITLLGGAAAAWPLAVRAQQGERTRRVGVLLGSFEKDDPVPQRELKAFNEGLVAAGWHENTNINIEYRWGGGDIERIRSIAKELVGLRLEAIVTRAPAATAEVLKQTTTIPIVFVQVADPISAGFLKSFAHPGANVTGFTNLESSIAGKWLGLLKELLPGLLQVRLIYHPETSLDEGRFFVDPFEIAATSLGLTASIVPVRDAKHIENAIATGGGAPNAALVVVPGSFLAANRSLIIRLAAQNRLPAIYGFTYWAQQGGLMSYGVDAVDLFRRAASYVDRILRGTNPGDLPVQAPTRFELVINLKTAKALGLDVPFHLQQLADEVIE